MTIIQWVLETGFFFSVEMSWHKLCAEIPDFIYDRLEISSIEAKMFFFFSVNQQNNFIHCFYWNSFRGLTDFNAERLFSVAVLLKVDCQRTTDNSFITVNGINIVMRQ